MIDAASQTAGPKAGGLDASGLSVRFQGLSALSDVDLALRRGEVLGLIGPNGAGKTTLVNCLTGFQRPCAGRVTLDGRDATGWSPTRMRQEGIARTFQGGRLFKALTVMENVEAAAVALGLRRRQAAAAARELLAGLGLEEQAGKAAGSLPYTDERRVGIARALVVPPRFLLLDEPAAGMADAECDDLIAFVAEIPGRFGCGLLLIEHNMRVVMSACDRILVLDGGRAIATGAPDEIRSDAGVIAAYLGEG